MNIEEFAEHLGRVEAKVEYHDQQINSLVKSQEALHKIATSVEILATKQGSMDEKLDEVVTKVEDLESLPAKRWRAVVEKILLTAVAVTVTAIVTYLLTKFGLGVTQ